MRPEMLFAVRAIIAAVQRRPGVQFRVLARVHDSGDGDAKVGGGAPKVWEHELAYDNILHSSSCNARR